MNKIKKSIIVFSFLFSYIFCVGEAGAIFLLINPGSSAAGVGEAQTGKADDAYASYYNPAGLAFLDKPQIALQHVNWLPNLAGDIYYEFITYAAPIKNIGTFGGHLIYLNLGEQTATDEIGNELGQFKSYMMALNGSFGMKVREHASIGFNFKVFHQKLADSYQSDIAGTGVGSEVGDPFSTDFAFDIGYLTKFGKEKQHSFGFAIQNIGPEIDFVDAEQADPAPTNMRIGLYTRLYEDDRNSIHLLFDANKLLVASYPEMDWNGNGRIESGTKEESHSDEWTKALYTAWLDDWYYGGDLNLCEGLCIQDLKAKQYGYDNDELDDIIGGYEARSFYWEATAEDEINDVSLGFELDEDGIRQDIPIYVPNYRDFCLDNDHNCYTESGDIIDSNYNPEDVSWIDIPHDKLGINDIQWFDENNPNLWHQSNPSLVHCSEDDIINFQDGCTYVNPLTQSTATVGDLMILGNNDILNPEFHTQYESNGEMIPIENDINCFMASLSSIPGAQWYSDGNEGFCYSGKSTCSEIGGDYSCHFDLSYNQEYDFDDEEYGVFNPFGNKEKGTGDERKFSDELKEMIYNFGIEWWYTENFAMRLGYIHDEEGDIKNPTFGAGVHFNRYGFDFGYTAGDKGHPRANTMFFSLSLGL
tara:strand:+ start:27065 stop:28996 length:1932 start_codon:yes stop_codon:yes gene_type:complete